MEYFQITSWLSHFSDIKLLSIFVFLLVCIIFLWNQIDKNKYIVPFLFIIILSLGIFHQLTFDTISEDSFIGFRYSRNLAHGLGLVFNPGEKVEGYSDFLWVIIGAGMNRYLGIDVATGSRILGGILSVFTLILTFFIAKKINQKDNQSSLLTILLLASLGVFASWGLSGLDISLFTFFLLISVLLILKNQWILTGICTVLMALTRIDGVIFLLPIIIYISLFQKNNRAIKSIVKIIIPFVLIYLPYTLWRINYFGFITPNTFAIKNGMGLFSRIALGIEYIAKYFNASIPVTLIFVILSLLLVNKIEFDKKNFFRSFINKINRILKPEEVLLFLFIGIYVSYLVYIGGDWMPSGRFIYVIAPIFCILTISLYKKLIKNSHLKMNSITSIIICSVICFSLYFNSLSVSSFLPEIREWKNEVTGLAEIGKWLHDSLPKDTVIAVTANGALSYLSQLPTIDMLGLTDIHIGRYGKRKKNGIPGHIAYDYEYVVSKKPKIICYNGGGFIKNPYEKYPIREEFKMLYDDAIFYFKDSKNPKGKFVEIWILKQEKQQLIEALTKNVNIKIVPIDNHIY